MSSPSDWLEGKTAEELDAIEVGGRVLFPDKIYRRTARGELEETPIRVRVLRVPERAKARAEAVAWAKKLGIDREADRDVFENFDTLCILARAIREPKGADEQLRTYEQLAAEYESRSLLDVWDRLAFYERIHDPRIVILTDKDFWAAIGGIARVRNISPLVAYDAPSLEACITRMASELLSLKTLKSSSGSTESSPPEPSPPTT